MVILSLCDRSGVMLEPWVDAGHECWAIDLAYESDMPIIRNGIHCVRRDLNELGAITNPEYDWCFAFPPCTHLASSGARWWGKKGLPPLIEALQIVQNCYQICKLAKKGWMIENPVGRLSTLWRKPDYMFHPHEYAGFLNGLLEDSKEEAYTKKTCLWTGGFFKMPEKNPVPPVLGSKMHLMSPSQDRQEKRSITPKGFARAVFKANK